MKLDEMERPAMEKRTYRKWIVSVLAAVLLTVVFLVCRWRQQETGYAIIQAIIEGLPDYQDEIESWRYRISVLSKMTREPDNAGLMRYYLKTVRLQICKRNIKQEPLFENTADVDSEDYYDVYVLTEITAKSLEEGNEVSVFGGGFFGTNYCSNNFEECRLWNGIDPASANSYSDHNIKQEYSAVQLLEYYRQGLELQNQLVELYHERQDEHDK